MVEPRDARPDLIDRVGPDEWPGIRVMRVLAELQPFYMLLGQTPAVGGGAGSSTTTDGRLS
jgi:hypothetical protein